MTSKLSVGHYAVDSLAMNLGIRLVSQGTVQAGETIVPINGLPTKVILAKTSACPVISVDVMLIMFPETLMNISGRPVATALRAQLNNPAPTSLVIIHDSLNHKPFSISHGFGGSAQGHNGVKDIISALGGRTNFHRLRVGIGRPSGEGTDAVKDYVLGRLSSSEKEYLNPAGLGSDKLWQTIKKIVQQGERTA